MIEAKSDEDVLSAIRETFTNFIGTDNIGCFIPFLIYKYFNINLGWYDEAETHTECIRVIQELEKVAVLENEHESLMIMERHERQNADLKDQYDRIIKDLKDYYVELNGLTNDALKQFHDRGL